MTAWYGTDTSTDTTTNADHHLAPSALCDGGHLDCGGGLLIAIRRALIKVSIGEILEIRSSAPSVADDLPAWCALAGHRLEATANHPDTTRYLVRRGR